jgi:hypothetical protein
MVDTCCMRRFLIGVTAAFALAAIAGAASLLTCELFADVNDTPTTCGRVFGL